MATAPIYFSSAAELRQWFAAHAGSSRELVIGFMKGAGPRAGITWPEAVDEALCVGWIDGVRRRVDEHRYTIRFTPRKPGSNWSAVNIERAGALHKLGRMKPAGLAAFAQRTEAKSRTASYEQEQVAFSTAELERFKARRAAWAWFEGLPPSYRRKVTWWIISAKQAATRERRLASFIEACAQGRRL